MKLKHILKQGFPLLLTLMLLMGLSITAFAAESSVTFECGKLIVFEPGSVYTGSDLFDNFKGVMPGDTLSEEITIQNESNDCDYIKVYMRAVLHDENGNPISQKVLEELKDDSRRGAASELEYMHDFLSQLSMTVKNGSEVIYNASPDQLDDLSENVYLGTIYKGDSTKLNVELTVPVELNNKYANRIGEVDWVFVVEGFDDSMHLDKTKHTVQKVWVGDDQKRPASITVQLLRDGEIYKEAELNADNHWAYTWTKLDEDHEWTAVEKYVPDGYGVSYTNVGNLTVITNTKKNAPVDPIAPTDPDKPLDLTVVKKWDTDSKSHPSSASVTLYNGNKAVETVLLGAWNNWEYSWKGLAAGGDWNITETNIPSGYVPSYSYLEGGVILTNSKGLIQTGQISWPIPVMGALGLVLIAYGVFITTKKRKNERA